MEDSRWDADLSFPISVTRVPREEPGRRHVSQVQTLGSRGQIRDLGVSRQDHNPVLGAMTGANAIHRL
jgi:hypothetical protein